MSNFYESVAKLHSSCHIFDKFNPQSDLHFSLPFSQLSPNDIAYVLPRQTENAFDKPANVILPMEIVSISSGFWVLAQWLDFSAVCDDTRLTFPVISCHIYFRSHTLSMCVCVCVCSAHIQLQRWHNCCHIRPLNGAWLAPRGGVAGGYHGGYRVTGAVSF